jgi:GDPmannose 4,6-dehydratase
MNRRALVTGITGQVGALLAEFLLQKGYQVVGMVRRGETEEDVRLSHLRGEVAFETGDLQDQLSLINLLERVRPHEVYNLAAQSFVPTAFLQPAMSPL